jgi:hypothetical protein
MSNYSCLFSTFIYLNYSPEKLFPNINIFYGILLVFMLFINCFGHQKRSHMKEISGRRDLYYVPNDLL